MPFALSKIMFVFFISIFIGWISLFGETIQAQHTGLVFGGLALLLIFSVIIKREFVFCEVDFALFLFLFIVTLGINISCSRSVALERYGVTFMPIPILYFLIRSQNRIHIYPLAYVTALLGSVIIIIGFSEIIAGRNIIYESVVQNPFYSRFAINTPRMMSTLIHPTVAGSVLVGLLPFILFLASHSSLKALMITLAAFLILGVIFSFSRGNVLGLIVLSLLYFWLTRKTRSIKFILIGMVILISLSSVGLKRNFSFSRFSLQGLSSQWWQAKRENTIITLKILRQHPFLGIGLNHFRLAFDRYCSADYKLIAEEARQRGINLNEWKTPDNMYLTILSETGLLGFSSFMFFLFLLFKEGLRSVKMAKNIQKRDFLAACLSAIAGMLISMTTFDLHYWINPSLLFWFLTGVLVSVTANGNEEDNYAKESM